MTKKRQAAKGKPKAKKRARKGVDEKPRVRAERAVSITEKPVDVEAVAEALRMSMAAHDASKEARRQHNQPEYIAHLRTAQRLRREAHGLDPERTAPAWQVERDAHNPAIHENLLLFYQQQLGRV